MITWRNYSGTVKVSAGLLILAAGSLWYQRQDITIMGQDIAECLSAKNERLIYGYATGTNDIHYVSNNVSTTMLRSQIYVDVLCGARDMMVMHWGRNILWLSPTNEPPKDGDYLIKVNTLAWTNSVTTIENDAHEAYWTNYYWTTDDSTITNIFDGFVTTATRTSNTVSRLLPFVPDGTHYKLEDYLADVSRYPLLSTNFPIASLVKGCNVDYQGVLNPFLSGSIWPEIGMGTNTYGYSIEQWYGLTGTVVNLVSPNTFPLSANTLLFPYGFETIPQSVTVTARSYLPNELSAGLCTASSIGRQSAVFAVSDGEGVTNRYISLSANYLSINEGASQNLTLAPLDGSTIIYVQYDATPIKIYTNGIQLSTYGAVLPPWPATITITATEESVKQQVATIVNLITSKNHQVPIAVGIVDNDGESDDIILGNTLLHMVPNGTANQPIYFNTGGTNIGLHVSSLITTQNLNEAKTVLQNLTRSVYICAHDVATCASSITTSYSTNTYRYIHTNDYFAPFTPVASDYAKTFDQSMWTEMVSLSDVAVTTNTPSVAGDLFSCSGDVNRWDDYATWYIDGQTYYDFTMTTNYDLDLRTMLGIKLPYPSLQACASGLVSKVTVFGVFQNIGISFIGPEINVGYGTGGTNCVITAFDCEAYNVTNDLYKLYGLCSVLCPERLAKETNNDVTHIDTFDSSPFNQGSLRLSKIGEWANPTTQPTFNLGDAFAPEALSPSVGYSTMSENDSDDMAWHYTYGNWERTFSLAITITHFVVVVDWNWKHLNPTTPFVPTNYTPAWVTANTNSP